MAPKAAPAAKGAAAKPEAKAVAKKKAKAEQEEDQGPKVEEPDQKEFDAAVAKVQSEIEELQKEQAELGKKISERSGGKDEYFAKRNEYRAQLDEFTRKIDELMARKEEINKGISEKRQEGADMRTQLTKMKKSIGYTSESEIDDRIATIEFKLWTDTLTLKQEKDYLKEIQDLKKNRPKVGQVHKMEDSLKERDTGSNLRENIGTINEEMALYRDGKRTVSQALAQLNEGRKEQLGDLPSYIEGRDALGKKIQEKMKERNQLRDEYRQKQSEFKAWKDEQRVAKQAKYQEEQTKKRAEWEHAMRVRKAEAMDVQPHVAEITLIEQTMLFCRKLVQDKGPAQVEEKKEIDHTNPDGTEVLLRKEDRDEEFYYAPTAGKKKGKSKNKGSKEGGAKPIKHNAETFKLFSQLKLSPPITTDDIPALLEQLEAQLESYKEKVKAWEINRDEKKKAIMEGNYVEEVAAEEEAAEEKVEEKEEEEKGEEKEDE